MKANELRIGNLFIDKLTNTILECIGIDKRGNFSFYVIDRSKFPLPDGWKAEPIPITEEWLLMAGAKFKEFKFENKIERRFYITISEKKIELFDGSIEQKQLLVKLNPLETWICYRFILFNENILISDSIKFVHQLQNLYFALTGNELIFNTNVEEKQQ